ncbi:MAG: ParB/RepB/Spo0J family partition protein [Sphingomonas oligoaromativorans]|jgi:ParB family chromosome partitioning protein|uniref:ParB/RepB/Spo0J family partition protein n=1 Tax=Sphingomonas oligoaromativorans TaxID=575322 RepID=UPI00141F0A6F|nr:ParB/RepB/Spo0J family partition protein [Sphingomonas oligoaromativorans]NIJ34576.1 ParB family chromosome partitioning protein [Sphingomonas oligoaromativorans]
MSEGAIPARRRPAGLGRGLSALMGEVEREQPVGADAERSEGVRLLPVAVIRPHPDQPRRHFDEEKLEELAQSIAERGVLQPIVVRKVGTGYQIVAGERRWRASQRARLHEIPALVRELDDTQTLEIAIIENIQRADLNAIEEAEAYQRLIGDFGHSQEALGKLVQKSRSHVANLLRLLDLPAPVRQDVANGSLTMGHARALITAPDPEKLAADVIKRGLSVRETEKLARSVKPAGREAREPKNGKAAPNADIAALERQLGDLLGLAVKIGHGEAGGTVTLSYSTLDQLDMICQRLSGERI